MIQEEFGVEREGGGGTAWTVSWRRTREWRETKGWQWKGPLLVSGFVLFGSWREEPNIWCAVFPVWCTNNELLEMIEIFS